MVTEIQKYFIDLRGSLYLLQAVTLQYITALKLATEEPKETDSTERSG